MDREVKIGETTMDEKDFNEEELIEEGFTEKDFIEGFPEAEDFEEKWEDESAAGSKPGWFMRTAALLIIVAFAVISFPHTSNYLTGKFNFLKQNQELMEDEIVQQCKPAVVSIEAGTRRGTGFNISSEGTIVTNEHVVAGVPKIIIRFGDGRIFSADGYKVIPGVDIAVLDIDSGNHDLPVIELDKEDKVQSGDTVTIIGNPLGFEKISQRGSVGHFHKIKNSQALIFDIKISVNPGSSGSPVLNGNAQAVGIVFASAALGIGGSQESRALAVPVQVLPLK